MAAGCPCWCMLLSPQERTGECSRDDSNRDHHRPSSTMDEHRPRFEIYSDAVTCPSPPITTTTSSSISQSILARSSIPSSSSLRSSHHITTTTTTTTTKPHDDTHHPTDSSTPKTRNSKQPLTPHRRTVLAEIKLPSSPSKSQCDSSLKHEMRIHPNGKIYILHHYPSPETKPETNQLHAPLRSSSPPSACSLPLPLPSAGDRHHSLQEEEIKENLPPLRYGPTNTGSRGKKKYHTPLPPSTPVFTHSPLHPLRYRAFHLALPSCPSTIHPIRL